MKKVLENHYFLEERTVWKKKEGGVKKCGEKERVGLIQGVLGYLQLPPVQVCGLYKNVLISCAGGGGFCELRFLPHKDWDEFSDLHSCKCFWCSQLSGYV